MAAQIVMNVSPSEIVVYVMKLILLFGVRSFLAKRVFLATSITRMLPFLSPAKR
jgi:hypothetical protein